MVPPSASSKRPRRRAMAPLKAPFVPRTADALEVLVGGRLPLLLRAVRQHQDNVVGGHRRSSSGAPAGSLSHRPATRQPPAPWGTGGLRRGGGYTPRGV